MIQASSQSSRFAEQDIGIDLKDVNISVSDKELLKNASVQLVSGNRYGLLGRNGVGKSILLTCLANGSLLSPSLREELRVMLIRQSLENQQSGEKEFEGTVEEELRRPPFGWDRNVMSELEKWKALAEQQSGARGKEARDMVIRLEAMSIKQQQEHGHNHDTHDNDRHEHIGEAEIKQVIKKVMINASLLPRKYSELSGGWKMRVQLTKALLYVPDVLLLDEPTNHLDIAGIKLLQRVILQEMQDITILAVSHDRCFLDNVINNMIIFKNQKLEYYKGNYEQYCKSIEEKEKFADRMQDALDRKKASMVKAIQTNRQLAIKAGDDKRLKQVASKKTKMEERIGVERNSKGHRFKLNRDRPGYHNSLLDDVQHEQEEKVQARLKFKIPEPSLPRSSGPLITVEDLAFQRFDAQRKLIFEIKGITFSAEAGQRLAILGPNGQGKSTLLNLLSDTWAPCKGAVSRKVNRVGYFRQDIVSELGEDTESPLERLTKSFPTEKQSELWGHLGSFGLGSPEMATNTRLCDMSGGQRVAFAFAELCFQAPALLLLDEPNSHLDLTALNSLEQSLSAFAGAIIFVSHDLAFTLNLATEYFWLSDSKLEHVDEDQLWAKIDKL